MEYFECVPDIVTTTTTAAAVAAAVWLEIMYLIRLRHLIRDGVFRVRQWDTTATAVGVCH